MSKIKNAIFQRRKFVAQVMHSLIVDQMPKEGLPEFNEYQVDKLRRMTLNLKRLQQVDMTYQLIEANYEYQRAQNQVLLDQYITASKPKKSKSILNLLFPDFFAYYFEQGADDQAQQFAAKLPKQRLARKRINIHETYHQLKINSLLIKPEIIQVIYNIKDMCTRLREQQGLFSCQVKAPLEIEEFKAAQDSAFTNFERYLEDQWTAELIEIIKSRFSKIGKGWFNIQETNYKIFEMSKTNKLLTLMRLMMQDTLYDIIDSSYRRFQEFLVSRMVFAAVIHDINNIQNVPPVPKGQYIFKLRLQINNEESIVYSDNSRKLVGIVQNILQKPLKHLSKIRDLTPSILNKLFLNQKSEKYLNVSLRTGPGASLALLQARPLCSPTWHPTRPPRLSVGPQTAGAPPGEAAFVTQTGSCLAQVPQIDFSESCSVNSRGAGQLYIQQNFQWLQDIYDDVMCKIQRIHQPLEDYIKYFGRFRQLLVENMDEKIVNFERESVPLEVIHSEYVTNSQQIENIQSFVLDEQYVGSFIIDQKLVKEFMLQKCLAYKGQLVKFISEKTISQGLQIQYNLEQLFYKLTQNPKNVHEWVELKDLLSRSDEVYLSQEEQLPEMRSNFELLEQIHLKIPSRSYSQILSIYNAKNRLLESQSKSNRILLSYRAVFMQKIERSVSEFIELVEAIKQTASEFMMEFDLRK